MKFDLKKIHLNKLRRQTYFPKENKVVRMLYHYCLSPTFYDEIRGKLLRQRIRRTSLPLSFLSSWHREGGLDSTFIFCLRPLSSCLFLSSLFDWWNVRTMMKLNYRSVRSIDKEFEKQRRNTTYRGMSSTVPFSGKTSLRISFKDEIILHIMSVTFLRP